VNERFLLIRLLKISTDELANELSDISVSEKSNIAFNLISFWNKHFP
jgi:hypothetical protein